MTTIGLEATALWERAQRFAESREPPLIGVVGEFSRGKSALINALLDGAIMPVHPLPTTAVPTHVQFSEEPIAQLVYADRVETVAIEDARGIVAGRHDRSDGLYALTIGWPHSLLVDGLVLLDTPGIGALDPRHRDMAFEALDSLAALIFVFAADPPLSAEEIDFLSAIVPRLPRVLLVQTKIDLLDESARADVLAFNRAAIDAAIPELRDVPIMAISALSGEGIAELRALLGNLDVAVLRQAWIGWRLAAIWSEIEIVAEQAAIDHDAREAEQAGVLALRTQLLELQSAIESELAVLRREVFAVLDHLSDYVLGNLSETIYSAPLAELSRARGTTLALDAIARAGENMAAETERASHQTRARLIERLRERGLLPDIQSFPTTLILPQPIAQTVAVRVNVEDSPFRRADEARTVKAYRRAVAHMAELHAARVSPLLGNYLDAIGASLLSVLDSLIPAEPPSIADDYAVVRRARDGIESLIAGHG